jgi:hypothetical protein
MAGRSARTQRGLGAFGTLILLAIVVVAAYYVYQEVFPEGSRSCKEVHQNCMKQCRRTATDQAAATACQNECQRALDACR